MDRKMTAGSRLPKSAGLIPGFSMLPVAFSIGLPRAETLFSIKQTSADATYRMINLENNGQCN